MDDWVDGELEAAQFPDQRLKSRLSKVLRDLGERIGATTPLACQDRAATKAAYRFFSNPRVDEAIILAGHFAVTKARTEGTTGTLLILPDTTEYSFTRSNPDAIGQLSLLKTQHATVTLCGLLMHSSLVLTTKGVPLGLAAVKFWTRKKFKGTNGLKGKINSTRIPIDQKESVRWLQNMNQATEALGDPSRHVHIGDRESAIFELSCEAQTLGTQFVVRTCVDRLVSGGKTTITQQMQGETVRGHRQLAAPHRSVRPSTPPAGRRPWDVQLRKRTGGDRSVFVMWRCRT